MSSRNIQIEREHLLFVEGQDEENFFGAFLEELGIGHIQIVPVGGRSKMKDYVTVAEMESGFGAVKGVGVVQDADRDPEEAKDSIRNALSSADPPAPEEVAQFTDGNPSTGMMVLPGHGERGMLEDLCLQSVEDGNILDCVDHYFDCVENHQDELPRNLAKARMRVFLASRQWYEEHLYDEVQTCVEEALENDIEISDSTPLGNAAMEAYLASQSKPRLDLGEAAEAGYFDFDHQAFVDVREFLEDLAEV